MNRYAIPALLVLLSAGVLILYVDPLYGTIQSGNTKIAEYDKLLADAKTATEKIQKLKSIQEQFPSGYDQSIATILPASIDPLRLVIDVNGIAALRGLHIKAPLVTPAPVSKKETESVRKNTLSFGISAPYPVFRAFLRDLESSLSIQDLSQLTFSSLENNETQQNPSLAPELRSYDYQVSVVTYSLPE